MITGLIITLVALLLVLTVPLVAFIALVCLGCIVSQVLLFVDRLAAWLEWLQIHLGERAREIEQKGFWR